MFRADHPVLFGFASPELEREFRAEFRASALKPTRVTLLVVIAIYLAYGVQDRVLYPELTIELWWTRLWVAGILAAAYALTYTPLWHQMRSAIVGTSALTAAGGLLAMIPLSPPDIASMFYTGVGLSIVGTCVLFRLRFPVAAALSIVIFALYHLVALIVGLGADAILVGILFLVSSTLFGLLAAYHVERYARRSFLHESELEQERERSERLLLNILPAPIAERLKREPGPIADHYPEASVLFADIADFTPLSASMAPEALVGMLDDVFSEFDRIASEHDLEKIKTIGDAYMAVAGVPVPRPDHLEQVVDAALAMREAIRRRRENGGPPLALRIGIDTGPVVAGVIGKSKFIYDLWGDAVNTASRMETHGVVGEIQVTEAVRDRLAGRYALRLRGEIEVKGKGQMRTYLLEALSAG